MAAAKGGAPVAHAVPSFFVGVAGGVAARVAVGNRKGDQGGGGHHRERGMGRGRIRHLIVGFRRKLQG